MTFHHQSATTKSTSPENNAQPSSRLDQDTANSWTSTRRGSQTAAQTVEQVHKTSAISSIAHIPSDKTKTAGHVEQT